VPEPLHLCGFTVRSLCGVDAAHFVSEVEGVRALRRQHVELMCARYDMHGYTAGIHEIDRQTTDRFGQSPRTGSSRPRQPQQIGLVVRHEGGAEESGA
jgi:hypothetical protein